MMSARRHFWIFILCWVVPACGHVDPTPQSADPKHTIVLDQTYFETHPESQAAWLAYALTRAARLDEGEYLIEVEARRNMIDYWKANGPVGADTYLDFLVEIEDLGFLEEYVIAGFGDSGWTVPGASMADLDIPSFVAWAEDHLQGHAGETRASLEPPRFEPPGADYPPPESFLGAQGLRCDESDEIEVVLKRWRADRRALTGRVLAASDGVSFLFALDELGTGGELSRTGATLVSQSIAELNFIGGFCAVERGDWKAAQRHLEEASSLDFRDTSARMELAYVRVQMGDFEPAEEQIAFVLANTQEPCAIARALRMRGFIQFERGALTEAYATYTRSLDYEPGSQLARSELSAIYQTMESQGFAELPPPEYVPPPTQQFTTQCTL